MPVLVALAVTVPAVSAGSVAVRLVTVRSQRRLARADARFLAAREVRS